MSAVEQVETKRLDERSRRRVSPGARLLGLGAVLVVVVGAYVFGSYQSRLHGAGRSPAVGGAPVAAPRGAPHFVAFRPSQTDLGRQLWDTTVAFDLRFVNDSTAPVVIDAVSSSCDCILLEAESYRGRSIPPGEPLSIPGTLDTGKHAGSLVRTVTLTSAAGGKYSAQLFLEVFGTWTLSTDSVDFGEVLLGSPAIEGPQASFQFVSDTDHLIGEAECRAPWLRLFTAQRDPSTTDILVRVAVNDLAPGINTANVVLRTSSPVRPDTSVYVRVRAVPALVAIPAAAFLVGDEIKRVKVTRREGTAATLARAQPSIDAIRAEVVGGNEVEIQNVSGAVMREAANVRIEDVEGNWTIVLVTAF